LVVAETGRPWLWVLRRHQIWPSGRAWASSTCSCKWLADLRVGLCKIGGPWLLRLSPWLGELAAYVFMIRYRRGQRHRVLLDQALDWR